MDARISGEVTRLRIQDLVIAADQNRRVRRPKNTRRPEPKGTGA
ncbi:MAG: hypothetical protein QOE25_1557 [Actinomycetota bacterium]|jgi:hypothetical protein|nr:hypothetical protein [Actinomycetota bacterium]